VEQAVAWSRRIGARRTWLTHIAHELGHEETNRLLPDGIRLAYDGLSLPVNLGPVNLEPANWAPRNVDREAMTDGSALPVHRPISVFHSAAEVPADFGPCVAAIGNFDGVHLGHRRFFLRGCRGAHAGHSLGSRHFRSSPGTGCGAPRCAGPRNRLLHRGVAGMRLVAQR